MDIGDRLRRIRTQKGLSQAEVAKAIGVRQQTYQGWESGAHGPRWQRAQKLAEYFQVSTEWLLGEKGTAGGALDSAENNVDAAPAARMVPLISWTRAGEWTEAIDPYEPGVAEEWIPAPREASRWSYCLRVVGDSMTSPHGTPSIPEGSIIIVDPDKRTPKNGQIVIARLNGSDNVTCKAYSEDAGRAYLRPLNPQYPTITDEFEVIGSVVGLYQDLSL